MVRARDRRAGRRRHARPTHPHGRPDGGAAQAIQGNVRNQHEKDGERSSGVPDVAHRGRDRGRRRGRRGHHRRRRRTTWSRSPNRAPTSCASTRRRCPRARPSTRARTRSGANVAANQHARPAFFLGRGHAHRRGQVGLLPADDRQRHQAGLIIAITAIGLSLIYGTTGLSNFAHGEMVTLGAIVAWWFNRSWAWHLILAALVGIVAAGRARGRASRPALWRPLRRREHRPDVDDDRVDRHRRSPLRYIFLFMFGGDLKAYRQYTLQPDAVAIGPIDLAAADAVDHRSSSALVHRRRGAVPAQAPASARRSGPCRTTPTWRRRPASTPTGSSSSCGSSAAPSPASAASFYGLERQCSWDMGFTPAAADVRGHHPRRARQPVRRAASAASSSASFVELWTWVVPERHRAEERRRPDRPDRVLLVRPQGILGSEGA